ncbi:hypothetical protein CEK29_11015 [Bordetella genomosp. 5]|uniref:helix-turn-helix domain-containing protein n=1 Tax=Bordetella genomosp. 5 TaxID=1395608 RepID=UPI000B9E69CA|nr:helix-turn-helix domain-containing protein [Bordetella genomosp. 5]OZI43664.1 hypothetical protein CEK29_11015 [Bordetella genomosp. 5]
MVSRKSVSPRSTSPATAKGKEPHDAYAPLPVVSLETAVLALMEAPMPAYVPTPKNKRAAPAPGAPGEASAPTRERTVRLRQPGGTDRRFSLKALTAPDDTSAVIFELRPLSDRPLPGNRPSMLSTQQAADYLNVSRPYVIKLVDQGAFKGVQRTAANHRRIPLAEVEKMARKMHDSRNDALHRIEELAADTHADELKAALATPARRWIRKP